MSRSITSVVILLVIRSTISTPLTPIETKGHVEEESGAVMSSHVGSKSAQLEQQGRSRGSGSDFDYGHFHRTMENNAVNTTTKAPKTRQGIYQFISSYFGISKVRTTVQGLIIYWSSYNCSPATYWALITWVRCVVVLQLLGKLKDSLFLELNCDSCKLATSAVRFFKATNKTEDEIIQTFGNLCETFRVQSPRVCRGIIPSFRVRSSYLIFHARKTR